MISAVRRRSLRSKLTLHRALPHPSRIWLAAAAAVFWQGGHLRQCCAWKYPPLCFILPSRPNTQAQPSALSSRPCSFQRNYDTFSLNPKRFSGTKGALSAEKDAVDNWPESCVMTIKSKNLAGFDHGKCITVDLGNNPSLVAVTGESGTGKSMLVHKAIELVMGGKASHSIMPPLDTSRSNGSNASVEVEICLSGPHFDAAKLLLAHHGIDVTLLERERKMVLKREMSLQVPGLQDKVLATGGGNGNRVKLPKPRLKSQCYINGQTVTLKALRAVAAPFITVVDASSAASALSKPNARMAILDKGVPARIKATVIEARDSYRQARRLREELENEVENKILPTILSTDDGATNEALDMLKHWVDELDEFERRIQELQELCFISESKAVTQPFTESSWPGESSYSKLLDFREDVKGLDDKIIAAESAIEALSSLSSSESVVSALERARLFLFDATKGETKHGLEDENESVLNAAGENAHDMLNEVEAALASCVRSLDNSNSGLLAKLQRRRAGVRISFEEIDTIIADWNSLARKHSASPFDLPSRHLSMRAELSGGDECREKLRQAKADEETALRHFERSCSELTYARQKVAEMLSDSVMQYLPSLGMEQSVFHVQLDQSARLQCTSPSAFRIGSSLGLDTVDFCLQHPSGDKKERGGMLEDVGSSGEKARILLAIESVLCGAVQASLGGGAATVIDSNDGDQAILEDATENCPPITVFYDEIDAHCGGRASVALAKLLASQTRRATNAYGRRGQIVSITHSPSVAAIADRHIVIQAEAAQSPKRGKQLVVVSKVDGAARRKELARMAAGDMAPEEAEIFADALLREGTLQRDGKSMSEDIA